MHDAIGDHEDAADALGGHVGEAVVQRREEAGPVVFRICAAALDNADINIAECLQPFDELVLGLFGLGGAFADCLAAALIDDDGDDIFQRLLVFAHDGGVEQGNENQREANRPQQRAAAPLPEPKRRHDEPEDGKGAEQRDRQKRREGEAEVAHYGYVDQSGLASSSARPMARKLLHHRRPRAERQQLGGCVSPT